MDRGHGRECRNNKAAGTQGAADLHARPRFIDVEFLVAVRAGDAHKVGQGGMIKVGRWA